MDREGVTKHVAIACQVSGSSSLVNRRPKRSQDYCIENLSFLEQPLAKGTCEKIVEHNLIHPSA